MLFVIGWQGALPFVPVLGQRLELDAAAIGLAVGIQGLAGLLTILPTSIWIGPLGADRLAIWATAGGCLAFLVLWAWPSVASLFVALSLLGACQMIAFMATQMLVVTAARQTNRDQAIGMFLFYTSVGVAFGPVLGSVAVKLTNDLRAAFLVATAAGGLALMSALALPSAPRTTEAHKRQLLAGITPMTHNLRTSLLATGVGDFAHVAWGVSVPLAMTAAGHGPAAIGTAFATRGAVTMLVRPVLGVLAHRYSRHGLMTASLFALGVGYFLSTTTTASLALLHTGSALFGVGTGLVFPLALLLATAEVADERIPQVLGLRQFVAKLGQIAGPVITGAIAVVNQTLAVALVASAGIATGLWVHASARPRMHRRR